MDVRILNGFNFSTPKKEREREREVLIKKIKNQIKSSDDKLEI